MAASPSIKVYDGEGTYRAAFKCYEDAAIFVAGIAYDEPTIRFGHSAKCVLWREGHEDQPASESYDHVGDTCQRRYDEMIARIRAGKE